MHEKVLEDSRHLKIVKLECICVVSEDRVLVEPCNCTVTGIQIVEKKVDICLCSECCKSANSMFSPKDELSGDIICRLKMNLRTNKVSEETEKIGGIARKIEN